jgi:hypothetical protein
MRSIDIHAHLVPQSLWQAAAARRAWYEFRHEPGDGLGVVVGGGKRTHFTSPKARFTPEERLKDMDAQGVDVQVISIHTPFFGYHLDGGAQETRQKRSGDRRARPTWSVAFPAGITTWISRVAEFPSRHREPSSRSRSARHRVGSAMRVSTGT